MDKGGFTLKGIFSEKMTPRRALLSLVGATGGFLFSRVHVVFGARPLALALISFLPSGVYATLLGAVISTLFSGGGFISAVALTVTLFVRVLIGMADRSSNLFCEPLPLRMAASLLGGFVMTLYEWLSTGVSTATALYGAVMILLPPIFVFVFSGALEFSVADIAMGKESPPRLFSVGGAERTRALFFYLGVLTFLHITTRSLVGISVFGIDFSLVFASLATLVTAARLGVGYAVAVGFASTLGIAGVGTVSFALLGLVSGVLFPVGCAFALVGGALAFCFWSGYSGGLSGVLSSVPELCIAVALTASVTRLGVLRRTVAESAKDEGCRVDTLSLVGTMALSYRSKYSENTDRLIASLSSLSDACERAEGEATSPSREDYRLCAERCIEESCAACPHCEFCERESICPARERLDVIVDKFVGGGRVSGDDINTENAFCESREMLAGRLNAKISELEYNTARIKRASELHREIRLISRLITEARERDGEDTAYNAELTETVSRALTEAEAPPFSVRVFGRRRPHLFLAVEDADSSAVASEATRSAIENALCGKICDEEYYKSGGGAMLECSVRERYSIEFAYKGAPSSGAVSGDTVAGIKTRDGAFYGILCDGMGRGREAHCASHYLCEAVKNLLSFGAGQKTLISLLSRLLERRGDTLSTLDLFRFDLYTGEAEIIKCGASPSYLKRGDSLYKIASEGAPIGRGSTGVGERVRLEVRSGDILVMASDGVSDTPCGEAALFSGMSGEVGASLSDFAESLVSGGGDDDKSVLVIKISECGTKRENT